MKLHKLVATFFRIGYIGKGGGTVAAAVYAILLFVVIHYLPASNNHYYWQLFITLLVCVLGVWSGNKVDAIWGKDSSKVVIDEVAGMMITMLFIPPGWFSILCGLILFRFFDIVKPLYIRRMEALPKGWGVMADDILAGIYANIVLQLLVYLHLFS